jgi:hypothetical protein
VGQDGAVTVEDDLLSVARRQLAPSSRWVLRADRNGADGFVIVADHPASAGLVLETATFDRDLAERRITWWMREREFAVADAAPELVHPSVVAEVRALAQAFAWSAVQLRTVAFLLFGVDAISADEAAWLAGFVAPDAPMVATPATD